MYFGSVFRPGQNWRKTKKPRQVSFFQYHRTDQGWLKDFVDVMAGSINSKKWTSMLGVESIKEVPMQLDFWLTLGHLVHATLTYPVSSASVPFQTDVAAAPTATPAT